MTSLESVEIRIFAAARWYVSNREAVAAHGRTVPELCARFDLGPRQAIEAIRHANAAEQRGA